jgi:hypothetical protein
MSELAIAERLDQIIRKMQPLLRPHECKFCCDRVNSIDQNGLCRACSDQTS